MKKNTTQALEHMQIWTMAWPDGVGTYWDSHTKCNISMYPYVHVRKRNSKTITSAHKDKYLKDNHKKKRL